MKTLVFVFALCAVAFALPRHVSEEEDSKESKEDDARTGKESPVETELFVVPLERALPPRGRFGGFGLDLAPPPFEQHPFFREGLWGRPDLEVQPAQDDFMTQMQEMLKEMRKQLTDLVQHAHHGLPGAAHGEDGETEVVGGGEDGGSDMPQNKTTSTTKVIDGHVVTVNETTFSSGDDNIGAVFRIKVVEVKPSETPETEGSNKETEEDTKETGDETKDTEEEKTPVDKSGEATSSNEREPTTSKTELAEDNNEEKDKQEETNEIPTHSQVHEEWAEEFDPSNNEIAVSQEWDEEGPRKENLYDLHGDTRVNDYVSEHAKSQGLVMLEPDAEFVDPNNRQYYHYEAMPQQMQAFAH